MEFSSPSDRKRAFQEQIGRPGPANCLAESIMGTANISDHGHLAPRSNSLSVSNASLRWIARQSLVDRPSNVISNAFILSSGSSNRLLARFV